MSNPSAPAPAPAPSTQDAPATRKSRLPSLDQLAARISASSTAAAPAASTSSSRSRLPASLLARTSSPSVNSEVDSVSVQPPSTRDISPARSASPNGSAAGSNKNTESASPVPGNELTAEHLERLNISIEEDEVTNPATQPPSKLVNSSKPIRGYKNVPTLEAITQRLRLTRQLSIDGSEAPPPASAPTQPAANTSPEKPEEHPLQYPWTLYYDTKARPQPTNEGPASFAPTSQATDAYEANLTVIGEFDTVEEFCRYFNWLKPPSRLERNSNYHLFKTGIKPMWEDEANANGGKWVLTMKNQPDLLDRCWSWLAMAMVGEVLDEGDEICGAVVSLRSKVDRIQLWIRSKDNVERVNRIGKKLVKQLDVSDADSIGLEFQYNTDERPIPQKFFSIQSNVPQSGFRATFNNPDSPVARPGPGGGAFGAFGTGGAFNAPGVWRGPRR